MYMNYQHLQTHITRSTEPFYLNMFPAGMVWQTSGRSPASVRPSLPTQLKYELYLHGNNLLYMLLGLDMDPPYILVSGTGLVGTADCQKHRAGDRQLPDSQIAGQSVCGIVK